MYFAKFDSFVSAKTSASFCIVVERVNGEPVQSSPIPNEALDDVVEELQEAEAGAPIHVWRGPQKELVVIPFQQIVSIRLVFAG